MSGRPRGEDLDMFNALPERRSCATVTQCYIIVPGMMHAFDRQMPKETVHLDALPARSRPARRCAFGLCLAEYFPGPGDIIAKIFLRHPYCTVIGTCRNAW
jgi:hypothetical protein